MATNPSPAVCPGCHAPIAPGATFCGSCGRARGAGPIPPAGGYVPPPTFPQWSPVSGGGFDTVTFAGAPDQAMPRLVAALSQAGARTTGQMPGGIRFQHGPFGGRMNGEATIAPDGAGNSVVAISVELDKTSFWMLGGIALVVNILFVTVAPILLLPVIAGFAGIYAYLSGSGRTKVRDRIMAAVRQAAASPASFHAGGYHAAPPRAHHAPPPPGNSATDRLRDLATRRDQGLMTSEEFDRAKATILNQFH